jgi:hypothetical protein
MADDAEVFLAGFPRGEGLRIRQQLGQILLQDVADDVGAIDHVHDLADLALHLFARQPPFFQFGLAFLCSRDSPTGSREFPLPTESPR